MVKFKYIGQKGVKDLDLVVHGVLQATDVLIPNTIVDVPDDSPLVQRLEINGNYVKIIERSKPKIKKVKKQDKEEE